MNVETIQIQTLITFVMPLVIQLVKRSQSVAFAWIDQNRPTIVVLTSAVTALMTSMGIEIVHDVHSVTVRWPEGATQLRGLLTFLVATIFQFGAQHVFYEGLWRRVVPSPSNQAAPASQQFWVPDGGGRQRS